MIRDMEWATKGIKMGIYIKVNLKEAKQMDKESTCGRIRVSFMKEAGSRVINMDMEYGGMTKEKSI